MNGMNGLNPSMIGMNGMNNINNPMMIGQIGMNGMNPIPNPNIHANGGHNGQYNPNQYNPNPIPSININNNKTWECAVCTYSNDINKASCIMCGLSKDSTQKANGRKSIGDSLMKQSIVPQSPPSQPMNGGFNFNQNYDYQQPKQPQIQQQGSNSFNFQKNALESMSSASQSQRQILSQFESNQMNAFKVTSPHTSTWICPMCTLHNSINVTRCDACNASRNMDGNGGGQPQRNNNPLMVGIQGQQ